MVSGEWLWVGRYQSLLYAYLKVLRTESDASNISINSVPIKPTPPLSTRVAWPIHRKGVQTGCVLWGVLGDNHCTAGVGWLPFHR